jgi:hypothetical protein
MAVDGATNGTRKLSAAAPAFLTSVTTPTLTSPAAIDLTLAGGSSGASLVLGQGTNGSATITPNGTGLTQITSALLVGQQAAIGASLDVQTASGTAATLRLFQSGVSNWVFSVPASTDALVLSQYGTNEAFRISNNRNLLIGTTSETGLTGAGGLKINSSTAGASNAGALVVTGGLSAGGASYIGGVLTANSGAFNGQNAPASGASTEIIFGSNTGTVQAYDRTNSAYKTMAISGSSVVLQPNGTAQLTATTTGTTIAGAVTIASTVIHTLSATPASASATGTVGTMSWDASYIYICTATNTWKRVAIATW